MTSPSSGSGESGLLRLASAPGRWVLLAAVLGTAIAAIDATVVGIALPAIGRAFGAGLPTMQWVVTAYTLTLSGLLLTAGALGDKYGRKRLFLIGVTWFALASALSAAAPGASLLITARALQGVGAALLIPGSLAILETSFRPGDRARAIGAWAGLSGVGTALGPFVGGWLIGAASWRLIFVINLPLAAVAVAVTARHVPDSRDPEATGPVDVRGGALATLGLIGLAYGLIEGAATSWSRVTVLAALAGGTVLLAAFARRESTAAVPVLPLGLFKSAQFSVANILTFVIYSGLGGALFLLPLELELVLRYTALQAGIAMLPATAIVLMLSAWSGALAARIGPRLQMTAGPLLVGAGLALLARIHASGSYLTEVLPAVVIFGLGLAAGVAPLTSAVLSAVPPQHSSMASAVNNNVARVAALISVAVLPAAGGIGAGAYRRPGLFSAGFGTACLIAAALCAAAGVLAAVAVRNPARPAGPGRPGRPAVSGAAGTPAPRTAAGSGALPRGYPDESWPRR